MELYSKGEMGYFNYPDLSQSFVVSQPTFQVVSIIGERLIGECYLHFCVKES